jgi:hypothetical protein
MLPNPITTIALLFYYWLGHILETTDYYYNEDLWHYLSDYDYYYHHNNPFQNLWNDWWRTLNENHYKTSQYCFYQRLNGKR